MVKGSRPDVRLWALALLAIAAPALVLLDRIGKPELEYPFIAVFGAVGFAIRGRWELRGELWFWTTIATVLGLHVPLFLFVPWKAGWVPAPITMMACIVDLALIYGIVAFVEKMMKEKATEPSGGNE